MSHPLGVNHRAGERGPSGPARRAESGRDAMNPGWDFHAIAPIIIVSATIVVVLIADFFFEYRGRFKTQQIAASACSRR